MMKQHTWKLSQILLLSSVTQSERAQYHSPMLCLKIYTYPYVLACAHANLKCQ